MPTSNFAFATDVIAYLQAAGLPRKHIDIIGSWPHGLDSWPAFAVGLAEMSDYEDVRRSLRLTGAGSPTDAETRVRAWMDRRLGGTNARFIGRYRGW
jgi:hypothetical protein